MAQLLLCLMCDFHDQVRPNASKSELLSAAKKHFQKAWPIEDADVLKSFLETNEKHLKKVISCLCGHVLVSFLLPRISFCLFGSTLFYVHLHVVEPSFRNAHLLFDFVSLHVVVSVHRSLTFTRKAYAARRAKQPIGRQCCSGVIG